MPKRKTDKYEPADDSSILTGKGRKSIVDELFHDEFGHYPGALESRDLDTCDCGCGDNFPHIETR